MSKFTEHEECWSVEELAPKYFKKFRYKHADDIRDIALKWMHGRFLVKSTSDNYINPLFDRAVEFAYRFRFARHLDAAVAGVDVKSSELVYSADAIFAGDDRKFILDADAMKLCPPERGSHIAIKWVAAWRIRNLYGDAEPDFRKIVFYSLLNESEQKSPTTEVHMKLSTTVQGNSSDAYSLNKYEQDLLLNAPKVIWTPDYAYFKSDSTDATPAKKMTLF